MKVTTPHDPHGGGHPRLIFAIGSEAPPGTDQRQFELLRGQTLSAAARMPTCVRKNYAENHAEIRRDAADEYVYVDLGTPAGSRIDGQPVSEQVLRTGDRIELGNWTVSYYREEFADHGRPYGGREGGEFSDQQPQDEPRPRGTTASGGSEPTETDPGEYY